MPLCCSSVRGVVWQLLVFACPNCLCATQRGLGCAAVLLCTEALKTAGDGELEAFVRHPLVLLPLRHRRRHLGTVPGVPLWVPGRCAPRSRVLTPQASFPSRLRDAGRLFLSSGAPVGAQLPPAWLFLRISALLSARCNSTESAREPLPSSPRRRGLPALYFQVNTCLGAVLGGK